MRLVRLFPFAIILWLPSCLWLLRPSFHFREMEPPVKPDYSDEKSWAAFPGVQNPALDIPQTSNFEVTKEGDIDVFFIHPTTYYGRTWNASLNDETVNERTDTSTVRKQASVFNGVGRIFVPRYRQATIYSFLDKEDGALALGLAYSDVLSAFDTYMKLWNQGRPIVIASHSQGTNHAVRLLKERFSKRPLSRKLIAAYLLGGAVPISAIDGIPTCKKESETGCVISWRSFAKDSAVSELPHDPEGPFICVNPLSWANDENLEFSSKNIGAVPVSFDRVDPQLCGAQCVEGILRVTELSHSGYGGRWNGNYHIADYALFYSNIRKNVGIRALSFKKIKR